MYSKELRAKITDLRERELRLGNRALNWAAGGMAGITASVVTEFKGDYKIAFTTAVLGLGSSAVAIVQYGRADSAAQQATTYEALEFAELKPEPKPEGLVI